MTGEHPKSKHGQPQKKYWQVAAGDNDRNNVEICLKWGVILNGPGNYGDWIKDKIKYDVPELSSKKKADLKRFCEDISVGDIIALHVGTSNCYGVGIVDDKYQWEEAFGEVDLWDIQHVRRIKWIWKNLKNPEVFPTYTFNLGDTTQRLEQKMLQSSKLSNWVKMFNSSTKFALPALPKISSKIDLSEIINFLEKNGHAKTANQLENAMAILVPIASKYNELELDPSEAETVTYLAVPFLRALGWTHERMAIEWNNIDIALFSKSSQADEKSPRTNENLAVIIEAKRRGISCFSAKPQAEKYATQYKNCKKLIVTDGIQFGVYEKNNDQFELTAYLDITRLIKFCTIYDCNGACEAILAIMPDD